MQTQGSKNSFYPKEPKLKDSKLVPSHDNAVELTKKDDKKDKKKRFQDQRQEYTREQKEQILAISITTTNILKKKKKKRNISEITCFNYNKKGYFASNYTKPKN